MDAAAEARWDDAILAAALFAVDPVALGGIALRARAGPARDLWLQTLREALPPSAPWRRMPVHIAEDRLLGGLDLAATLRVGKPVAQRGLLAEIDGGVLVLSMAERLPAATTAQLRAVLDRGELALEREGIALRCAARFGVVALDESLGDDAVDEPRLDAALADRLALHLALDDPRPGAIDRALLDRAQLAAARARLPRVTVPPAIIEALCGAALALGIASLRASTQAVQLARVAAACDGRDEADEDDARLAARLVLAPRATVMPASASDDEQQAAAEEQSNDPPDDSSEAPPPESHEPDAEAGEPEAIDPEALQEILLAAAAAALPPGLLERLRSAARQRGAASAPGRAGALHQSSQRGRPAGVRCGSPAPGVRMNLIATLRGAAPWQALRRAERAREGSATPRTVDVRREDFHVTRHQERRRTTTIFAIDASGSSALHRLAEAKGAIELMLGECYVRRDEVAVIAFRGQSAEIVLPPTRSLLRAKRGLAGLPGGGGTPLASGIDAGLALAEAVQKRGATATLVLLTDGRANINREGRGDRRSAQDQARASARRLATAQIRTLLIDTSPRPQAEAGELAALMHATYLPLPHADSHTMSAALIVGSRALR